MDALKRLTLLFWYRSALYQQINYKTIMRRIFMAIYGGGDQYNGLGRLYKKLIR